MSKTRSKSDCILGIIGFSLGLAFSVFFRSILTDAPDARKIACIMVGVCVLMVFGLYRSIRHLVLKPEVDTRPTIEGVKYNPEPVPLWKVALDYFNPLKMRLGTMFLLFLIYFLWMLAYSFRSMNVLYFWIPLCVQAGFYIYTFVELLMLTNAQNKYGQMVDGDNKLVAFMKYNLNKHNSHTIALDIKRRVNVRGTYEDYRRNMDRLSPAQRHVVAVDYYVTDVYGEGHEEFFTTCDGVVYEDAIEGLKAMGADGYAEILATAAERFEGVSHPIHGNDKRIEIVVNEEIDFSDDDNAIYRLDIDGSAIEQILMDYIRAHADDFES